MTRKSLILACAAAALAVPAIAQVALPVAAMPGALDVSRIAAGTYAVDTNHTQVLWTLDHFGFTPLSGVFHASGGSLTIDPATPAAAKVTVNFTIADTMTSLPAFTKHLLSPDLLDVAKFGTASFTSTAVKVDGTSAEISGDLTIRGITKPVILDAKLHGAGTNPRSKKLNVGFSATTRIKRSEFGLTYQVPNVSDEVDLAINAAFAAA